MWTIEIKCSGELVGLLKMFPVGHGDESTYFWRYQEIGGQIESYCMFGAVEPKPGIMLEGTLPPTGYGAKRQMLDNLVEAFAASMADRKKYAIEERDKKNKELEEERKKLQLNKSRS